MKKILSILLLLAITLSLFACSVQTESNKTITATVVTNSGQTKQMTLQEIKEISESNSLLFEKEYVGADITVTSTITKIGGSFELTSWFKCEAYVELDASNSVGCWFHPVREAYALTLNVGEELTVSGKIGMATVTGGDVYILYDDTFPYGDGQSTNNNGGNNGNGGGNSNISGDSGNSCTTTGHNYQLSLAGSDYCSKCGDEGYITYSVKTVQNYISVLKDPNSAIIHSIYAGYYNRAFIEGETKMGYVVVILDASAKNSFGGYVRDYYICLYDYARQTEICDLKGQGQYYVDNYFGADKLKGYDLMIEAETLESICTTFDKQDVDYIVSRASGPAPSLEREIVSNRLIRHNRIPVAEGKEYKIWVAQENLGRTFYVNGEMSTYYLATTQLQASGISVRVAATEDGYYLYYVSGNQRTFINIVQNGQYINVVYGNTAISVYRYDSNLGTLVTNVNGTDYYLGTDDRRTYDSLAPCAIGSDRSYFIAGFVESGNASSESHLPAIVPGGSDDSGSADESEQSHNWLDSTCTEPRICLTCGATSGEPRGHYYEAGTCSRCGVKTKILIYSTYEKEYVTDTEYLHTTSNGITKLEFELSNNKNDALAFTVVDNGDGTISFQLDNGMYLYCDANDVTFSATQSDYTKFVLEKVSDGYYIRCAVANYNGKPQYLEVYRGYLTCYSISSTSDLSMYTFKLENIN